MVNRYTRQLSEQIYRVGNVVFDLFALTDMDNRLGLGPSRKYDCMAMAVGHPEMRTETEDAIFSEIARHTQPLRRQFLAELSRLEGNTKGAVLEPHSKGPAGW